MTPRKNSPEILALSSTAQAILATQWMMGVGTTLTLKNQISQLTPECDAAMRELVSAGIVSDEKADDGYPESRSYKLTEKGARMEYRKPLKWIEEHAKFSLVEKIV